MNKVARFSSLLIIMIYDSKNRMTLISRYRSRDPKNALVGEPHSLASAINEQKRRTLVLLLL